MTVDRNLDDVVFVSACILVL